MLISEIKEMVSKFFSDTSRPAEDTLGDLEELRDHIEILIEAIQEDLATQEKLVQKV